MFWTVPTGLESLPKMIDSNKNFKANVSNVVVNTFPADG